MANHRKLWDAKLKWQPVAERKLMYITSDHIQLFKILQVTENIEIIEKILNLSPGKINTYRKEISGHSLEDLKSDQHIKKEERINFIMISLLKKRKINLTKIATQLDVTRRIINMDLLEIKSLLSSMNIQVISLNSKGIFLDGDETIIGNIFFNNLYKLFIEYNNLPPKLLDMYIEIFPELIGDTLHSEIVQFIKNLGLEYNFYNKITFLSAYFAWNNSYKDVHSYELSNSKYFQKEKISELMEKNTFFKISPIFFSSFLQMLEKNSEEWNWDNRNPQIVAKIHSILENFYKFSINENHLNKILPLLNLADLRSTLQIKDLNFIDILSQNGINKDSVLLLSHISELIPGINFYEIEIISQYLTLFKTSLKRKFQADCLIYDMMPFFLVEEYKKNLEEFFSIKLEYVLTLDEYLQKDKNEFRYPVTFENHEKIKDLKILYFDVRKIV